MQPDYEAVKNCKIIYRPRGRAYEYAPLATNPYRGCGHGCVYCYVPDAIRMPRSEFDETAIPRKDYIKKLIADAKKYQAAFMKEQVLLSFTTDPFNPHDTSLTRPAIEVLKSYGLSFVTLSKGGSRALPFVDLYRPGVDHYACTLTTLNDSMSLRWERGAALPQDRIDTLRAFHDAGIYTWVSLEPTLDADTSIEIVRGTHGFVNLYKVGKLNYVNSKTDWRDYVRRMVEISETVDADFYFKEDLKPYMKGQS